MMDQISTPEIIEAPVRVLNETDTGWLVSQRPFGQRDAQWLDKSEVEIPDRGEIKPMQTARMSRAYAIRKGVQHG